MKPSATSTPVEFSASQRAALLKLLGDEDPEVYHQVREKILSAGPQAVDWLRPHSLSGDPLLRARALSIIRQFERHAADNDLVAFCLSTGEELCLEKGIWLLARTTYPEISTEGYTALLDMMAADLSERMEGISEPRQILRAMRLYLFDELKFAGDGEEYYSSENSYFNRVLDRRKGNPISLCSLYLLLARRLRLPISGIGLPGHFLCRLQTSAAELYVDCFNGGKILSKARCIAYLMQNNFGVKDEYLTPVSPRRMLLRMCANLHQIYAQNHEASEATRLRRYMVALSR